LGPFRLKEIQPSIPKKILVIRLKGIGDVILSTPLFRALRKSFPRSEITLLTRAFCEPVARFNPNLDRVLPLPPKSASLRETALFLWELREARYDWVLDLAAEPRSAWLTLATGAPLRAGYAFRIRKWAFNRPIPKNKIRKYQVEVNLDISRALGVPADGDQTEIFLGKEDLDWVENQFANPPFRGLRVKIGLNPTSTWPSKRWPVAYWKDLILKINQTLGVAPILLGGPGAGAVLAEIKSGIEDKTLLKPETTLLQAAAFISKLDLVIGYDGTPQHMAQAFGVKSLTLSGPHWGLSWTKPDDPRHRYLQHFLDCGPCNLNVCPFPIERGKAPHVRQECLLKIPPALVLGNVVEMLGSEK